MGKPASRLFLLGTALLVAGSVRARGQNAAFASSPSDPSPNQLVTFTDTTSPRPTSWLWTFGDPDSGAANTSTLQNPTHVYGKPGVYPVTLTVPGNGPLTNPVTVAAAAGACVDSPTTLCLDNGRFQVSANWTNPQSQTGTGNAVKLTDDSGYFWFFDPANIEMVVKVLNGCAINNAYWVFAAGLTNVQVNWLVTDLQKGIDFPQVNPLNTPFVPVQATDAFPTSCP